MTIHRKLKFTPELFVSSPRPSPAEPNEDGTLAVYSVGSHDLDTHAQFKDVKILDLTTGKSSLFTDDMKNTSIQWLTNDLLIWQRQADGGKTELWIGSSDKSSRPYLAGTISAAISNVKTKKLSDGSIAFVFTAAADEQQNLCNTEAASKPPTTAREWEYSKPRAFDAYIDQYRSVLWFTTLKEDAGTAKYKLSDVGPINALRDTGLAVPFLSDAVTPTDYDISENGIVFTTVDPEGNDWKSLEVSLYYLPISTFQETDVPPLKKLKVPGVVGNYASPKFAPQGRIVAVIGEDGKDHYARRIIGLIRLDSPKKVTQIKTFADHQRKALWEVYPGGLYWSNDGKSLYLTGAEKAYDKVFRISTDSIDVSSYDAVPTALNITGSVSSVYVLGTSDSDSRLLVNSTSFVDPGIVSIVEPAVGTSALSTSKIILSTSNSGSLYGISSSQVSSIHYPGGPDGKTPVQCWIVTPSSYDPSSEKKYPFFLFMHGGPQAAVRDQWSFRWNPLFIAEQGYIVAVPNFTGSDSFGQDFLVGIDREWGGAPYKDLERCWDWVDANMPKCDLSRAIAAGASYGGYMANWVAGQPLAKKLKAIVSHDGILDSFNDMLSDDMGILSELNQEMGPAFWDSKEDVKKAKEIWRRNNPIEYTDNWSTPMLFIHSDKDYRCPITAGWAGYNICKLKDIPTRYLNYPDENHWVLKPENALKWHKVMIGWTNKYVGMEDGIQLEPPVSEAKWLGKTKEGRIIAVDE